MKNKILIFIIISSLILCSCGQKQPIENAEGFLIEGISQIISIDFGNPMNVDEWKNKYSKYDMDADQKDFYTLIIRYSDVYNKYYDCDSIKKSKEYEEELIEIFDNIREINLKYIGG